MGNNEIHTGDVAVSHGRQLAAGSLQGFLGSAVSLPTGIITAAFLSRHLGPAYYGLLTVVCLMIAFIETGITLGFERAAVKLTAGSSRWRDAAGSVIQAQLLLSFLATVVIMAAAPLISAWMHTPELAFYLRIYAVGIPISGLSRLHQAVLVGRGRFKSKAWLDGGYWIIRLVLIVCFCLFRPSVTAVLIANMVSALMVLIIARTLVNPVVLRPVQRAETARLWMGSGALYGLILCIHLCQSMDMVFVTAATPANQTGFFAAAKNLTIIPTLVTLSLTPVLLAKLSELLTHNRKDQAGDLLNGSIRYVVCLLPFAGLSAGAAGEVVQLIYGNQFQPAAPLLAVLIFGAVCLTLTQVNAAGLIAAGKAGLPLGILGPLIPLAAMAYWYGAAVLGPIGAAGITTGLALVTAVLTTLTVRRVWSVPAHSHLWLKTVGLSVLAFSVAGLWQTPGLWVLVKLAVVTTGILAALVALGELSPGRYEMLLRARRQEEE